MSDTLKQLLSINKWRSGFNPLRGLTIQRAASLLDDGERGAYADLQWTYRYAERRHPTLRGLKRRRLSAIGKLDWNIKVVPTEEGSQKSGVRIQQTATDRMAEAQAAYLRERYDAIDNLRQAIRALALAEFRGFSHLEAQRIDEKAEIPIANPSRWDEVNHFDFVEQWFWVRDGLFNPWQYNGAITSGATRGDDAAGAKLLVREVEDPINEIALIQFVRAGLCEKDWDAFVEIYGLARPVVIMPPNIPAGKESEYEAAAEAIANGEPGALPNGSDAKYPGEVRGNQPFGDRLKRLDEQLVLAGTGGKLTMLSEATGIGGGASDVQADVFEDIAIDEAGDISEIFQKQFDKQLLAEKFPGQPVLAYFEIAATEETDVSEIVKHALELSQAGYRIETEELSEKTGYDLIDAPVPAISNQPSAFSPVGRGGPTAPPESPSMLNRFRSALRMIFHRADPVVVGAVSNRDSEALAAALRADLAPFTEKYGPLLNRLKTALAMEPDPMRAELDHLRPELEAMRADMATAKQVLAGNAGATLLGNTLTKEFFNSLAETKQESENRRQKTE